METSKEYVLKNAVEYLDNDYKDKDEFIVTIEGNEKDGNDSIYSGNYDLCLKILPIIGQYDKRVRYAIPSFFHIPNDVFEPWSAPSCWELIEIHFKHIKSPNEREEKVKGFVMVYCYNPPENEDIYSYLYVEVKFREHKPSPHWPLATIMSIEILPHH